MSRKVAVVTGSNSGIGFQVVKALAESWDGDVIMCAMDEDRLQRARLEIQDLPSVNQSVKSAIKFAVLRIDKKDSVQSMKDRLINEYGGLDILVNNAGMAYLVEENESLLSMATETINVNTLGTALVCDILFPILRPGARVVNMSSSAGMLRRIPGQELRQRLGSNSLTRQEWQQMVEEYLNDIREGVLVTKGWPHPGITPFSSYTVSKVFVSALTWIQHRNFSKDSRQDIVVNAVHPGYIKTELTGNKGFFTPKEGARAPTICALIPPEGEPRGNMVTLDGSVVDWHNDYIRGGASS